MTQPLHALERFAVVVGNNLGDRRDTPLRYAEDDAVRMAEALTSVGGFPFENVIVMRSPDAGAMRQAILGLNERLRALSGPGTSDSMLLVYYSGHGDAGALHLGETPLPLIELERMVRSSPARFRVLVSDACRSGTLTRSKGGRPAPPVALQSDGLGSVEGTVILTASAAGEDAQESDALQGSFFTHHLVSGLLGAADDDDDGEVTLSEAYRYAHDQTLRDSSATLQGTQHPAFRYDVRGSGDVVWTRVREGRGRGRLVLPQGLETLVFTEGNGGRAIAELRRGEQRGALLLREGSYFVRARAPRLLFEGTVRVAAGATTTVDTANMRRFDYARLSRKGAGPGSETWGIALAGWMRTGITGPAPCSGGSLSASFVSGALTLRPTIAGCQEQMQAALSAHTQELNASLALDYSVDLPWQFVGHIGPELGIAYLQQQVSGQSSRSGDRNLAGPTVGVALGLDWEGPWGIALGVTGFARTYVLPVESPDRVAAVSALFTQGAALSLQKWF